MIDIKHIQGITLTEESKNGSKNLKIEQNSFNNSKIGNVKPAEEPPEVIPMQPKWYEEVLGTKKFNKEAKKPLPTNCQERMKIDINGGLPQWIGTVLCVFFGIFIWAFVPSITTLQNVDIWGASDKPEVYTSCYINPIIDSYTQQ